MSKNIFILVGVQAEFSNDHDDAPVVIGSPLMEQKLPALHRDTLVYQPEFYSPAVFGRFLDYPSQTWTIMEDLRGFTESGFGYFTLNKIREAVDSYYGVLIPRNGKKSVFTLADYINAFSDSDGDNIPNDKGIEKALDAYPDLEWFVVIEARD